MPLQRGAGEKNISLHIEEQKHTQNACNARRLKPAQEDEAIRVDRGHCYGEVHDVTVTYDQRLRSHGATSW